MSSHHREPIKHTCPDIDKLIKGLNEISKMTRNYERIDEVSELKDLIYDLEYILSDFEGKLEELRNSNDTLRNWGIDEACNVDDLETEKEIQRRGVKPIKC